MRVKIKVSDKVITALAEHIAKRTDGVLAVSDRSGRSQRGRAHITKDRRLELFVICRYGANTTEIYNKITGRLFDILGPVGDIKGVNMRVIGVGK